MEKNTFSHYGWIVVMLLCMSVVLALATPLGEYIGGAVKAYVFGFTDAVGDVEENIEADSIDNDIDLNGLFIVTDKQGTDACFVYRVNDKYDGYSLVANGNTPNIDERYFRSVKYSDIEERRGVKELFYLAASLGYDDTVEGRQGVAFALLNYVNGNDYSGLANGTGGSVGSVYADLLAKKGSIDKDLYEGIQLVTTEKDGLVDMIIVSTSGAIVGAPDNDNPGTDPDAPESPIPAINGKFTITYSNVGYLDLNNMRVYCNERSAVRPSAGDVYTLTNYEASDYLKQIMVAIDELEDGTSDFRMGAQYAIWQAHESLNMVVYSRAIDGEGVSAYVEAILNRAETVNVEDYTFKIAVYECDGFQDIIYFKTFEGDRYGWLVPAGGQYTTVGGTVYTAGQRLPDGYAPQTGDIYVDADYEYRYNQAIGSQTTSEKIVNATANLLAMETTNWSDIDLSIDGWGVRVRDTSKTSYNEFNQMINYAPIVCLDNTFMNCDNMVSSPAIPKTVKSMTKTYFSSGLEVAPKINVVLDKTTYGLDEERVLNMIFADCQNLRTYEGSTAVDGDFSGYKLPTASIMYRTFANCDSMVIAPALPKGANVINYDITGMYGVFMNCDNLTTAPALVNTVKGLQECFADCPNLITYTGNTDGDGNFSNYFSNVSNLTVLKYTFANCDGIVTAPVIKSSVTDLYATFMNCNNLTGSITINSSTDSYTSCLANTQITEVLGSTPYAAEILATK